MGGNHVRLEERLFGKKQPTSVGLASKRDRHDGHVATIRGLRIALVSHLQMLVGQHSVDQTGAIFVEVVVVRNYP